MSSKKTTYNKLHEWTTADNVDVEEINENFNKIDILLSNRTVIADPTNNLVPIRVGEEVLDTVSNTWYKSHGLDKSNWKKMTV